MHRKVRLNHRRLAKELSRGRLSQNAWARRFGLSKSYLSELVNGKRRYPGRGARKSLLRGLHLEFDDLFEYEWREWDETRPDRPRMVGRLLDWSGAGYRLRLDRVPKSEPAGANMFDNFRNDVRFALRTLSRSPLFAMVTLATLTLGVAVNIAAFTVVNSVLLRSLPFDQADRLLVLGRDQFYANRDFLQIAEQTTRLGALGAMSPGWTTALIESGNSTQVMAARVSSNLFRVLGVRFALGRGFADEESLPGRDQVVILSYTLWRDRYGADAEILQKSISVDGESRRVIGVLPPDFELLRPDTDLWMTLPRDSSAWFHTSRLNWLVGRLEEDAGPEQAQQELDRLLEGLREEFSLPADYAEDARVINLLDAQVLNFRALLSALFGACLIVMAIAALNLAHLILTRLGERGRELALRQALGAPAGRLRLQLLTETGLLALLGTALGALVSPLAVQILLRRLPQDLPRRSEIGMDATTVAFTLLAGLVVWILLGLAPILYLRLRDPGISLTSAAREGSAGQPRNWSRTAFVVAEIALAQALIISAGLMIHSVINLNRIDPGFDAEGIYTFAVQPSGENFREARARLQYYERLREQLQTLPGVEAVGSTQHLPLTGFAWATDVKFEAREPSRPSASLPRMGWRVVDNGFFNTLRIPILEGRAFDDRDTPETEPVVIVNRAAVRRYWGGENPLGKRIQAGNATGNEWATVVGVVGDVKHSSLSGEIQPALYRPYAQHPLVAMNFVLRSNRPESLVNSVRQVVWSLDDRVPISDERTFRQIVDDSIAHPRMLSFMLGIFSALGLLLGVIGVYGLVAFSVTVRRREFGIRMAIGAQRRQVLGMVVKQGLYMTAIGILLGSLLGLGSSRLLSDLLFQIAPYDPFTYLVVSLTLGLVALLASYLPARRATQIDPAQALRDA